LKQLLGTRLFTSLAFIRMWITSKNVSFAKLNTIEHETCSTSWFLMHTSIEHIQKLVVGRVQFGCSCSILFHLSKLVEI
jgi:hypothetical protein